MNNWKVIPTIVLATVLIFGAGVFTGGMLVDYVKRARPRPVASHPVAMVPTNALTATNLATPLPDWTPLLTNQFDASGNFHVTNSFAPRNRQQFYRLEVP